MRLLASVSPGEQRVALLRDDVLEEFWVERPARPDGVGDLQRARVVARAPAMAGAFLALAGDEVGFLPDSAVGAVPVQEGQLLGVRVTRAAQGGKGPRVTARLDATEAAAIAAAPAGAPRLVARGPEAALRLARAHTGVVVETDGAALASRLRAALGPARVVLRGAPVFDDALETEVDALASPEVALPGGGRLLIHPTPALTAIDVDAGAVAGARDAGAQGRLNLAAIAEAARQMRLRRLAGPILLDIAGMPIRRRQALAAPLEAALAGDAAARLLGVGPLGLFEILRQRVHPPLHEVWGGPASALTVGLAALRRLAREVAAAPGMAPVLRAAPGVLAALRDLPGALAEAEALCGRPVLLRADPAQALPVIEDARHG